MFRLNFVAIVIFIFSIACVSNTSEDCTAITGASFSSSGGQIQSIINTKCSGSACHSNGGTASIQWTIGNFNSLKPHFERMYKAIENGEMPKAGSPQLTTAELEKFECWAQSGYPE